MKSTKLIAVIEAIENQIVHVQGLVDNPQPSTLCEIIVGREDDIAEVLAMNSARLERLKELHEQIVTGYAELEDITDRRISPAHGNDGAYLAGREVQGIIAQLVG